MIKHIVMWKIDESYSSEEKAGIIEGMKKELLSLDGKIGELKSIMVLTNSPDAPESNYDVVLDTEFNSIDDLNAYQVHPEHKKVVAALSSSKKLRAAIDYEF